MGDLRFAHLSDLHVGRSKAHDAKLVELERALRQEGIEHLIVTGDITHRGAWSELERFDSLFHSWFEAGRVTLVPGNHDRLGEDAGASIMQGERVLVEHHPGLFLVRVDSTGPHNRRLVASHGDLCPRVLEQIDHALKEAPPQTLRIVLLHHHVLPLPEESVQELLVSRLALPHAGELSMGRELVERVRGRVDSFFTGTGMWRGRCISNHATGAR